MGRTTECPPSQVFNHPFTEIHRKMDLLLFLGRLLMENGANTNQIVRDVMRASTYMGIPRNYVHMHITYTTLMLNIHTDERSYTAFHKTLHHGVNMTTLSFLSKLTWRALDQNYTLDEFESQLNEIASTPLKYPTPLLAVAAGTACGAFAINFGGDLLSAIGTIISALVGFYARRWCNQMQINFYFGIAIASFVATAISFLLHALTGWNTLLYAMISCTLFMVPGIPLINAVDDTINNHIMSGMTRAINTLLIVGSMSVGIATALYFDHISTFTDISVTPVHISPLHMVAGAVGAIGFSLIFNTPFRLLYIIGIGGAISIFVRNFLIVELGFTTIGSSFVAAAIIGLLALSIYKKVRTAPLIIAIPSVIPMIPGVLLYRFLYGVLTINTLTPDTFMSILRSGITGALIIICIAIGVSIPHILARGYLDRKKEKNLLKFIHARRQRG
ncbi:threonine/serine exporter ThrE family protein [uncultured Veillonella sp.]|uniref:threonine/serine ThrE exporter family protein n=1 Tax=uncultured Veillonella sp. TaxID=159268 RepID=UPI0025F19C84|nr:threonine/serine exporter family protein [uncultured Veillonella sp.]MDY3974078.1 threonine/serine exporter family protein [Veillonella caviae]